MTLLQRRAQMRRQTQLRRGARIRSMRKARASKYGVSPRDERMRKGLLYDSKLEMRYAEKLDILRYAVRPAERVTDVLRQVSVRLEVNGLLICRHIVDFVVTYADGRQEWHEVKGLETPVWKIKAALFKALYPERRYVVIKQV